MLDKIDKQIDRYFIREDFISYFSAILLATAIEFAISFSFNQIIMRWYDCLAFFFSSWTIRCSFPDTYHDDSWNKCKLITRIGLYVGVLLLRGLPSNISVIGGILLGFICSLILYVVKIYINKNNTKYIELNNIIIKERIQNVILTSKNIILENELTAKEPKKFCLETCTEDELILQCKLKGFKPHKIKRAIQHFILKLEHKEIDPVRPNTSETERNRMRKKLSE